MSAETQELARLYTHERLTLRQVAKRVGLSPVTVLKRLKLAGVARRGKGTEEIAPLRDKRWLEHRYLLERKSTTAIAKELGCGSRTVSFWLKRNGIQARPTGSEKGHKRNDSEDVRHKMAVSKRQLFIGSGNPNWKGGVALKDPDRNRYPSKMWVRAVKDRDGWKCTECSSTDRLHAHHIKKWVDYPELRYELGNGVTLCHDCHEVAHGDGFKFRWPQASKSPTSAPVTQ